MSAEGTSTGPTGVDAPPGPEANDHDVRAVLAIKPFRALWLCLGLSSLGDWLGLLATTSMAATLGARSANPYTEANLAVSGVLVLRLAPAMLFGPLAGAVADRWDRKVTMVVGDLLRFALFLTIPLVGTLWWLFAATLLIEAVGLFWTPAKDATVPNLVPRHRLEAANQLGLVVTYGTAPIAAVLFSGLALVAGLLPGAGDPLGGRVSLSLYADALTYLVAALVVSRLAMPSRSAAATAEPGQAATGLARSIVEGWRFVARTPLIRGLVLGMLGAFAAGGFVIGVAPTFVADLGAGEPGYGLLFGCVFTGLALGMWTGPRVLAALPRWRLFALALVLAGLVLVPLSLIPDMAVVAGLSVVVGACGGVAWVTGYTLLGLEVADELRGRTFAFVQSAARIVLIGVLALAPALAALFGQHELSLPGGAVLPLQGASLTLLVAAVIASGIGVLAYRQLDDGCALPLRADVVRAWRLRHSMPAVTAPPRAHGFFVALEGGDGSGKSTQAQALRGWLSELGHEVLTTREPGATPLGAQLREQLLHGGHVAPRAEALLYAADRAQHVEEVVRPALERGALVVSDRYIDSSIAYQGAARHLDGDVVARISAWATDGLLPDVTVLLDLSAEASRSRLGASLDRLEREPQEFHEAVRSTFLELAARSPRRYVVVDAAGTPEEVAARVRARVEPLLPLSPRQAAEHAAELAEQTRLREEAERAAAAAEAARRAADVERRESERAAKVAAHQAELDRRAALREERAAAQRAEAERRDAERREADREREAARLSAEGARTRQLPVVLPAATATNSTPGAAPADQGPVPDARSAETAVLDVGASSGSSRALEEELFSLRGEDRSPGDDGPPGDDRPSPDGRRSAGASGRWDEDDAW